MVQPGYEEAGDPTRPEEIIAQELGVFEGSDLEGFSHLTTSARAFVLKHLDPCGEFGTTHAECRPCDGALPNSVPGAMREAIMIKPPNASQASLPLDGDTWTVMFMHLPCPRTPLISIASLFDSDVSQANLAAFANVWNTLQDFSLARYPNWYAFDDGLYFQWMDYVVFRGLPPPLSDGTTTAISQYRIAYDGLTGYFNAPDIVNQGMGSSVQVPADHSYRAAEPLLDSEGNVYQVFPIVRGVVAGSSQTQYTFKTPWTTVNTTVVSSTTVGGTVNSSAITATSVQALYFGEGGVVVQNFAVGNFFRVQLVNLTSSVVNQTVNLQISTDGTTFTTFANISPQGMVPWQFNLYWLGAASIEDAEPYQVNVLKLVPVGFDEIFQSSPQAVVEDLRITKGFYMPKRVWQPIMNVAQASTYAPLKFTGPGVNPSTIVYKQSGQFDTVDLNYGVGINVLSGISTSTNPMIKMKRMLEMVADPNGPLVMFQYQGEPENEAAMAIIKEFRNRHPHAYPATYNGQSKLLGIIENVLSTIPIFGSVARPIANICSSKGGGR